MKAEQRPRAIDEVTASSEIDAVNRRRYASAALPREYARSVGLQPPEQVVLARIAGDVRGTPILDLGVGAGRTTSHLRALSEDYLGVDYSPTMIGACRRKHPDARFEVRDVRSLDDLPSGRFGLVMFSFNGLDCIDHDERAAVLHEIERMLRPGGWFVFSSHNRDAPTFGYRRPPFYVTRNPVRLAARGGVWCVSALVAARNRRRLRKHEFEAGEYAVRNDDAHDHSLLTYYIRVPDQFAQLARAGFTATPTAYALDGHALAAGEICRDAWVYYALRKDA